MTALKQRVSSAKDSVFGQLMQVTPEMAVEWLTRNTTNRNMRPTLVRQYASDMLAGRWHLTGEPIIFGTDGRLENGQHRLKACILADTPFHVFVVFGVAIEAQKYMDSGAKRGAHDALAVGGSELDNKNIAAVARGILQFEGGNRPSQAEIVDFAEENIDQLDMVTRAARAVRLRIGGRVATYGTADWYLSAISVPQAALFFSSLETGEDMTAGDPRLVLRNYVIKYGTTARNADKSALRNEIAPIFKAWNAWREGKSVSHFRFGRTEAYPQPK